MEMTLRYEIFPADLDAVVDFYVRVLGFSLVQDRRDDPNAYVSLRRGAVQVGAAKRADPGERAARLPPVGVELVLEVDDVAGERDRVVTAGWPLDEDLQDRPWGLTDFRILDPAGYFLRVTSRAVSPSAGDGGTMKRAGIGARSAMTSRSAGGLPGEVATDRYRGGAHGSTPDPAERSRVR
jgi:lactoylglutathione lyase